MSWIEIVNLRTAGNNEFKDALKYCCHMQYNLEPEGKVCMQVYRNNRYATDLGIHLCWDSASKSPAKTSIGIKLSKSLTRFGLTDHQVWQPAQAGKGGVAP